jgi:hypothetical protein
LKPLKIITGRQAVQSYSILEFDIVEMVKNHGLQPYSANGEPLEAPFQYKVAVRIESLTRATEGILKADSTEPLGDPNCEMRWKTLGRTKKELESLVRENPRSWEYLHIPEEQSEKDLLVLRMLSYSYKPEDIERIIAPPSASDTPNAIQSGDDQFREFLRRAGNEVERLFAYVEHELKLFDKGDEPSEWYNTAKSNFERHRQEWTLLKKEYIDDAYVFRTIPGVQNKRDFVGKVLQKILIDNGHGLHRAQKLCSTYNALKREKLK